VVSDFVEGMDVDVDGIAKHTAVRAILGKAIERRQGIRGAGERSHRMT